MARLGAGFRAHFDYGAAQFNVRSLYTYDSAERGENGVARVDGEHSINRNFESH